MRKILERFSLEGRVAVVTGASEGIGYGLAMTLAEAGADVIVASRREDKLHVVKTEIEKLGRRSEVFRLDVTNLENIRALKPFAKERFGKVDILVNAAAFTVTKPAWEVTEADWDIMQEVSLKGLFFCCQTVGELMREQQYGKIINLSSTFSRSLILGRSVYVALKAGVSHLTDALATEWAKDGIRVNALAPTATETPTRMNLLQGERREAMLNRIPLGRFATIDDFVGAITFLASPASDFVTGHTLFVDGGWVAAS
jgi:NAD(P)-dependent dehydrogenase (short-subunit alcohol dehydrogenase family)